MTATRSTHPAASSEKAQGKDGERPIDKAVIVRTLAEGTTVHVKVGRTYFVATKEKDDTDPVVYDRKADARSAATRIGAALGLEVIEQDES